MMQMLQIGKIVQIALILMVVVAVWQAFNGDLGAIAEKCISIVQAGADVMTKLWATVNSKS